MGKQNLNVSFHPVSYIAMNNNNILIQTKEGLKYLHTKDYDENESYADKGK